MLLRNEMNEIMEKAKQVIDKMSLQELRVYHDTISGFCHGWTAADRDEILDYLENLICKRMHEEFKQINKTLDVKINSNNELVLHTSHTETELTKEICIKLVTALQNHLYVLSNYNLNNTDDEEISMY